MTFDGGSGADSIVVNDQNNPYSNAVISRIYTVTDGVGRAVRQTPVVPRQSWECSCRWSSTSPASRILDLTTGGQNDVVSVVSKTSGETRIRTGNGDDVIVVAQTAGNLETVDGLEVDGQAGFDDDSAVRPQQDERRSAGDGAVRRRRGQRLAVHGQPGRHSRSARR